MTDQRHTTNARILVVDDAPQNLYLLSGILSQKGYDVRSAPEGALALDFARANPPDLILLDVAMPDMNGYEVCAALKAEPQTRDIPIIFISALDHIHDKVKGFQAGGMDYITKPFYAEEVLARVEVHLRAQFLQRHLEDLVSERTNELQQALEEIQRLQVQLQAENLSLREEIRLEHDFTGIIGRSEVLKYLLFRLEKVAAGDTTVLISGETGTGKELIARAVHAASNRRDQPLVKVNCAALPSHLIESELFGHEKGAFTGATTQRLGRFEIADGATLFLDEIGELPLELQAKLLRIIQDGEFERVGSSNTRTVNVRLITATNRNLEEEVRKDRFRQDLYYRLNVYTLFVPPLRERPEDIPLLVRAFVQRFNKTLGKQIDTIPQNVLNALQAYQWPGNVRELENVIERAVILTPDRTLHVELPRTAAVPTSSSDQTLETVERAHILRVLEKTNWVIEGKQGAAQVLGLNPSTLRSRMRKLGMSRPPLK